MDKVSANLKESYENIAAAFASSRAFSWPELQVFIPYLKPDSKIVDLGCGNGRVLKLLAETKQTYDYLGVDFSANLIKEAEKNWSDNKFVVADMTEINYPAESFDVVLLVASFHHLTDKKQREELLAKIYQWLKPDGLLFMTNWNLFQRKYFKYFFRNWTKKKTWNDFFIPWNHGNFRFYHSFTKRELKKLLLHAGFKLQPKGVYQTKFNLNALVKKQTTFRYLFAKKVTPKTRAK